MKTLSIKLPLELARRLDITVEQCGASKSAVLREALQSYLAQSDHALKGSFADLAGDLAGAISGPADLSVNKRHLKGYGA